MTFELIFIKDPFDKLDSYKSAKRKMLFSLVSWIWILNQWTFSMNSCSYDDIPLMFKAPKIFILSILTVTLQ